MGCSNAYYSVRDTSNNDSIRLPQNETPVQNSATNLLNTAGVASLGQFSKINEEINEIEALKMKGLSDIEIKLYLDFKKGQTYLEYVHKNMESSELHKTLRDILERTGDTTVSVTENDDYRSRPSTSNSEKHYSMDQNFQIKKSASKRSAIHDSHPINHLTELEDDLFGHLDVDKLPPVSKRRKFARRMARKYAKEIPIPEPTLKDDVIDANQIVSHTYNDFIKQNTVHVASNSVSLSLDMPIKNPNSKWDIKDIKTTDKNSINIKRVSINKVKRIGCSSDTLYTIKNSKIVRLEPKKICNNANKMAVEGNENNFEIVDIKLPINKAEERLLEGTKLSITDIKMIPKFKDYQPGELSKTLFLKNIASAVTEMQLKELFQGFGNSVDVKLMTGRMKGQAFVTFDCSDTANSALHQRNGTILRGKPIIIQFGKKGNG